MEGRLVPNAAPQYPPFQPPSPRLVIPILYRNPYQQITGINGCSRVYPCSVGKTFDRSRCKCVCITQIFQCPGSTVYNSNICQCECPVRPLCNQFQRINLYYCQCELVGLNQPGLLLPTCPPSSSRFCSPGQIFNPTTCQCECSHFAVQRCTSPQCLDPVTCECVCSRRNAASCTSLQRFNSDKCECECSHNNTRCRFPQILDPNTCQCSCQVLTCNRLQRFNSHTCQCECMQVYVTIQVRAREVGSQTLFLIPWLSHGRFRGKRNSDKVNNVEKLSVGNNNVEGPSRNLIRRKRQTRTRTGPGRTRPGTGPGGTGPGTGPGRNRPGTRPGGTGPGTGPGRTRPSTGPGRTGPGTGPGGTGPGRTRPSTGPGRTRPSTGPGRTRPSTGPGRTRPGTGPGGTGPGRRRPGTRPGTGPGSTGPGTGQRLFLPSSNGFLTTQRQLIAAPCPAGTFLRIHQCECI